jgi:ribosomal protein S18 acetylase RimI-like enzyme
MSTSDPWLSLHFSKDQCAQALARPELKLDGAVDEEGQLAGFLASVQNGLGLEPLMEYLCVAPDLRDSGAGTALINYFEGVLYPDARNLYLFVSDINPAAARLYIRLGYLPVGALPNYNLEMQTEFLFRKTRGPKQARLNDPRAADR